MALREQSYPTRARIAERFEVTTRTVDRDLEYMRDRLGAPIEYDAARRGFYYSDSGFYLPRVYLSEGDAMALFLAHHFGSLWRDTPLAEGAEKAWRRLGELFPEHVQLPAGALSNAVTLIDRSVAADGEHWMRLLEGAVHRRTVRIAYRTPGSPQPVSRTVHPYRLLHHRDAWYVLAYDTYKAAIRIFALSRISHSAFESVGFGVPEGFDPADYIDPRFGAFHGDEYFAVRLVVSPAVAEIMLERLRSEVREERLGDGNVALEFDTNQREETTYWVLQWGTNVRVEKPQFLRDELARIGRWYAETYDPRSG